ncbi:MAG TPA: pantoate--beta-alanine ligase [Bacillus sp. (in: firmicutes)]|jgi:pantoate--beta-alanine ligase|nr:pantoate--beta-alanine ligase [Bacillus sp. (in: firmicutes)]
MKVVNTITELQELIKHEKSQHHSIGLVPTMGFLHEGHRALLKRARQENEMIVLSVFVNPLQFGPNEDLANYPRDFDRDQKVAEEVGVDILFHPSVQEMYPNELSITMQVHKRTNVLCGKSRPGHFDGVVTVLTKLFHLVQPNKVYFGKKDAQQVAVVDSLVNDLNFPLQIVAVDTVREHDGLAKSSRNVYLTEEERAQAPILYRSLQRGLELIRAGEKNPESVISCIADMIHAETTGEVDYVSMLSYPNLEKVELINGDYIIALAVKFSKARLIDNVIFKQE